MLLKMLKKTLGRSRRYGHTLSRLGGSEVGLGGTREAVRELYDAYARRDFDRVASYLPPTLTG